MPRETLADLFASFADFDEPFLVYDDGYRASRTPTVKRRDAADASPTAFIPRAFGRATLSCSGVRTGPNGLPLSGAASFRAPSSFRSTIALRPICSPVSKALRRPNCSSPAMKSSRLRSIFPFGLSPLLNGRDDYQTNPMPPISRDDTAEILFTSGATADPKGVIIQHRNVLANVVPVEGEVRKYRKYAKPFHPIRFLNLLPLSHMFGQAMATFIPPMLPGVVVFMRGYNPHEIVRQIHSRRISVLVCVPKILDVLRQYVLRAVPEAAEAPPPGTHWLKRWWIYRRVHKLLGWKFWAFIVGAAPLPPELEEFWSRLGFVVIQGYGLTETAPIVTLNHPFHTRKGSVGKPIAGVEVKISDDGEILVRGDNVTSGYLNPDAESAKAFEDGWFHTGDVGSVDEAGRLSIRGRKKEMIVTPDGLNIFPEDVEGILNEVQGVRDSAVVGVTQDGRERVHAVLAPANGADAQEIVRKANAQLEDHQRVRGFSVWPSGELPRTEGTRKLKRRELRALGDGGRETLLNPPRLTMSKSVIAQYAPGR